MEDQLTLYNWSFVASTWDGQELKIYINGSLIKTVSFPGISPYWTGVVMQIGKLSAIEAFQGKIDEVKIYNYELSQEELSELYSY